MTKGNKHTVKYPKPRPDKYSEKVKINVGFDEVLKIFSDAAHENTDNEEKIEEPNNEPKEEC